MDDFSQRVRPGRTWTVSDGFVIRDLDLGLLVVK
jgi:hypothetical protein